MSAHQIFFHIAWTTRDRAPMIDAAAARFLDSYFRKIIVSERAALVGVAILRTHVHLVLRTQPHFDLPRLVQALKGGSSYQVNRIPGNLLGLRWGREYSVTSISPRHVPRVLRYLDEQGAHHPGEAV